MYSSPVRHSTLPASRDFAFDLHALATPPAFDLSQDQTRQLKIVQPAPGFTPGRGSFDPFDLGCRACFRGGPTGLCRRPEGDGRG